MESNKKAAILNMDIIVEIISRLRAKDLIRFKSVCKHWFQVISSKLFIKLHLLNSRFKVPGYPQNIYFTGSPPHRNFLIRPQPQCRNSVSFVGNSSDGLMCLLNGKSGIIHIWNPSIRKSACFKTKIIPDLVVWYWFGIHDDEYKVVIGIASALAIRDVKYQMHLMRPGVDSHSYKTTTLGLGEKCLHQHFYCGQGTLFGGNVHWSVAVGLSQNFKYILCCNLREGKVGTIHLPKEAYCIQDIKLGEMDGCFCALISVSNGYEVWVMKEYGVEESWTKLMFLGFMYSELRRIFESRSRFLSTEGCVESLVSPSEGECCHNSVCCSEYKLFLR